MSYLDDLFSLEGKTAVVTGASRGIGRAAAVAFGKAGASVVLVGRDVPALDETASMIPSGFAIVKEADVTKPDEMNAAIDTALRRFEGIDILVNNAGIIRRAPAIDYSGEDWMSVIDTNLNSVFSWSQAVGRLMVEQRSGKIINIASMLSFSGGFNVSAYAAAKGGVAQLTKALANEWAKYNVQVNAIAPGYFLTNATAALRSDRERSQQVLSRIPTGRWGEPDELAGAFLLFASSASDYISGHVMVVDGGFMSY